MKAGRELDALIAEKVMGWKYRGYGNGGGEWTLNGKTMAFGGFNGGSLPNFSTNIADAWEVVELLAPLAGDFCQADGYFHLTYADSADHSIREGCEPGPCEEDEDGNDVVKWSAHFHPGVPCEGSSCPAGWLGSDGPRDYCARAATAPLAICLAALKAKGVTHE